MVKLVSKGFFYNDKTDEAIKLYEELVEKTRKERGCISYNLFQDKNDKTILTMIEEWENDEALEAHKNTEHFKRIVPILGTLRIRAELNTYDLVL